MATHPVRSIRVKRLSGMHMKRDWPTEDVLSGLVVGTYRPDSETSKEKKEWLQIISDVDPAHTVVRTE